MKFAIVISLLLLVSIFTFSLTSFSKDKTNEDFETTPINLYQGPVPEGCNEGNFRWSGVMRCSEEIKMYKTKREVF